MKRTAVRKRRPGTRRGPPDCPKERWRNPRYLAFLRQEGRCIVCCRRPCDPAHGSPNGNSQNGPDAEASPLCRLDHMEQTKIGWPKFQEKYGIDRKVEAEKWWKAFKGETNG